MAISNPIEHDEIWRPVVNWEDLYSISSFGKVRRDKSFRPKHVGHIMSPRTDRYGYLTVLLRRPGKQRYVTVHRLVTEAFIGPCPRNHGVNHKDGCKKNNHVSNLEYMTNPDNVRQAAKMGLMTHGERCHSAKLTAQQIPVIRRLLAEGVSQTVIAKEFGVNQTTISSIHRRKKWKHIK